MKRKKKIYQKKKKKMLNLSSPHHIGAGYVDIHHKKKLTIQ